MSTRDWDQARRELIEEGRKRVGPPPDFDTVEALLRGELPEAEAQRVREVLAYYPELVQAATAPAPSDDEAVLTDAEEEADVARLRQRLDLASAPVVAMPPRQKRSRWLAVAAALVAVSLGLIVVMQSRDDPRSVQSKTLIADADRGPRGSSTVVPMLLDPAIDYRLKPLFRPARAYAQYRFEFSRVDGTPRSLWIKEGVQRQRDGSFPVDLSTEDLEPGLYELVLYGGDERLATYTLRVDDPARP